MNKPSDKSEDESGAGAPKAVQFCKNHRSDSYIATTLAPNRRSICVPLDSVSAVDNRCHAIWATACLPYKFCKGTRPIVHNGEETPSSSLMLTQMVLIHSQS